MSDDNERPPHDLGGLTGGPIDREEHEPTFWEQRVGDLRPFEAAVFARALMGLED